MASRDRGLGLRGRRDECALLDRLVAAARAGESQVLVLRGEAGIGKTALLDYVAQRAAGCRIVRAGGAESEMELPFAGMHQLCAPMMDRLDRLPGPQRDALATAFGLSSGNPPGRFLVGLAVLSLLSDSADEQPVVCLVDDAQWLDRISAQTLPFVARRLMAEPIAMVFAIRDPSESQDLAALPALEIGGLRNGDARVLLESAVAGRLDVRVRDQIVAETRGNPLALLELPRGLSAAHLAGGFALPDESPLASRIEQNFLRRLGALPAHTRRLLLAAAAEPVGDASLLLRAAERMGIDPKASAPAEAAGLIELGPRVRFRHPLVRSAIYRAATPADRRDVHRALADATDPGVDPDRRAWHRAHAAAGADEEVAAELVSSADRAQRRGGAAAAAELLRQATELTPDPATRAIRALAAAQAEVQAGAFEPALNLLLAADDSPIDELHQARVNLLKAQIAFAAGHDMAAPRLLLDAARRLEPLDSRLARTTYRDATAAAILAGGLADETGMAEVAQAMRAAPRPMPPRPGDLLLDSLVVLYTDGYEAALSPLREAIQAFRDDETSDATDLLSLWLAATSAAKLWDDEGWSTLTERHVRTARQVGALSELPLSLNSLVVVRLFAGELAEAASLVVQIQAIAEATGSDLAPYGAITLAAWRGDEAEATPLIDASMTDAITRGEDLGVMVAHWARSVLLNGLGRYQDAVTAARAAAEHSLESNVIDWALTELIESAVRSGQPELATGAYERLAARTRAAGTDWSLGILARSGALRATGSAAETLYQQAIEHLSRCRIRTELARVHLLYGEWLRRENRRVEARDQLGTAHEMLTHFGAEAFAERARCELQATGVTVPKRAIAAPTTLTPQEAHIARLASEGLTNPEIGAQLFLSPHTVEWHLRKVFAKLGIRSRKQLRATLAAAAKAEPA